MLHCFDSDIKIRAIQGVLPAYSVPASEQLKAEGVAPQEIEQYIRAFGYQNCRFLLPPATLGDMMISALRDFMRKEQLKPQDIDALINVTQTPDYIAPCNSFFYHQQLDLPHICMCLDLYGTCSGVFNALYTAATMLQSSTCNRILIVVGDCFRFSQIFDFDEPAHLFSDGGGILLVEKSSEVHSTHLNAATNTANKDLPLSLELQSYSAVYGLFVNRIYSTRQPSSNMIRSSAPRVPEACAPLSSAIESSQVLIKDEQDYSLQKKQLFKTPYTIQKFILRSLQDLLHSTGLQLSDVGCGVLYQMHKVTIEQMTVMMNNIVRQRQRQQQQQATTPATNSNPPKADLWANFDVERPDFFPFVAEDVGHQASASIPIALSMAKERFPDLQQKPVFLSAFGLGLSITSALVDFSATRIYPLYTFEQ